MITDKEIGLRIHHRRSEKGYSIRELTERASLSPAFISQIERGKVSASLESLRRLAGALEVPMAYFFSENPPGGSILASLVEIDGEEEKNVRYSPVVRAGSRPQLTLPNEHVVYELLSNDLARKMEATIGQLKPGQTYKARRLREPTEEIILVLSGSLQIALGEDRYFLYPGDSVYFDGEDLKEMTCASRNEDVVWLSVMTPPMF